MSMRWQPPNTSWVEVTVGYANRDRVYKWKQSVQMVTDLFPGLGSHTQRAIQLWASQWTCRKQGESWAVWRMVICQWEKLKAGLRGCDDGDRDHWFGDEKAGVGRGEVSLMAVLEWIQAKDRAKVSKEAGRLIV